MYEAMKAGAVPDKHTEEYVEAELLPEVASGASSANVLEMDEDISVAAVPDQQNKESVESKVLPGKTLMFLKIWIQKQVLILK